MMAMHDKIHDNREEVELKTITCTDKLRSGTSKAKKRVENIHSPQCTSLQINNISMVVGSVMGHLLL